MKLLDDVGAKLQALYTYADLNEFFRSLGISTEGVNVPDSNSKKVYSKSVLASVSETQLKHVAVELGLALPANEPAIELPSVWQSTNQFRLFISHISKDKGIATRLKIALENHAINGFVAHEDITPTKQWMDEVERGLRTMDAMVAVHTVGFSASVWTQQEIGFALGTGKKLISFNMGELPMGFDSKYQALPRENRNATVIAAVIADLLLADDRTVQALSNAQAADFMF